jgi:hypothetical protein
MAGGRCWVRTNVGEADGFTDRWRIRCDLRERSQQSPFRHALGMIMLRLQRSRLQGAATRFCARWTFFLLGCRCRRLSPALVAVGERALLI